MSGVGKLAVEKSVESNRLDEELVLKTSEGYTFQSASLWLSARKIWPVTYG